MVRENSGINDQLNVQLKGKTALITNLVKDMFD